MRRTSILLLAGLSILLAIGNVLQWRHRLEVYFGSRWLGIQTLQNPTDVKRVDAGMRRAAQGDSR